VGRVGDQRLEGLGDGLLARREALAHDVGRVADDRAVAEAAAACGREVIAVGRAMDRVIDVARECGYLDGAKVVTATRWGASAISVLRVSATVFSLGEKPSRTSRSAGPWTG
jgi:mRNA degradation ribonuclease J1/J2